MRKVILLLALSVCFFNVKAIKPSKVKPVKNIILLISDGTSVTTMSTARWLQYYNNSAEPKLNLDPYLCGTVKTFNSDAPIGDSAPTTSCYMTGHASQAGYVSTVPPSVGVNDLDEVDTTRTYAPMATLLEAGKQLKGKATGLVVTCYYTHATPADCAAHYYDRGNSEVISNQMVYNNLDVVIGGGNACLTKEQENYLKNNGWSVLHDDINGMRTNKNNKMWCLYGAYEMSYEIDRKPAEQPSLAEMTRTAINKLSKNKNGFFLMVEGSQVDWAAHANDITALPTEFLAFDKACGEALDFARKDGNTLVIITCDHSNSGFSMGTKRRSDYGHATKEQVIGPLAKYKMSAGALCNKLNSLPYDSLTSVFEDATGIKLNKEEFTCIVNAKDYKSSPIPEDMRTVNRSLEMSSSNLETVIKNICRLHTFFDFTTGGHTGEDVFLAAYHPKAALPMGMNTNKELAHYMQAAFGLYGKIDNFTHTIYAPHTDVFGNGYECNIVETENKKFPNLEVKNIKNGKTITIKSFTNIVIANGKEHHTASIMTYVDKTGKFYVPKNLVDYLK